MMDVGPNEGGSYVSPEPLLSMKEADEILTKRFAIIQANMIASGRCVRIPVVCIAFTKVTLEYEPYTLTLHRQYLIMPSFDSKMPSSSRVASAQNIPICHTIF